MIICERFCFYEDFFVKNSIKFLTFNFGNKINMNLNQNHYYIDVDDKLFSLISIEIIQENKTYVVRDYRNFIDNIYRPGKSFGSLKRAREYVDKLIKQYDYKLVSEQEFKKIELLI